MAESAGKPLLSAELGVAAVLDMAERRGLHASRYEVEQAWQEVAVEREEDRLAAAWQWLFEGHSAATSPVSLLTNSQLPAWIVGKGCVGVMVRVATSDEAAVVEWVSGSPEKSAEQFQQALVPVPPLSQRTEAFVPPPKRGAASEAIIVAMKAHASIFARVGVASIFINAVAVVAALFAMQVYDRVVPNMAFATLWFLASGVLVAYVLDLLFKYARMRMMEASERRLDEALSQYFFDRVLALKIDRRPSRLGSLVAQIKDYEAIKTFFTSSTLFTLADLPFVIIFITIIFLIGGPVALVPATFVVLSLLVGLAAYGPIARRQREENEAVTQRQGLLFEAVAGSEVIKAQGGEARFGDMWLHATRETAQRTESLRSVTQLSQSITQFFQQLAFAAILIVGVYTIAEGNLTMGGLIACMILGGRTLNTISGITGLLLRWHHARYALRVLNELLACPSDDKPGRQANTRSAPLALTMHSITYGYGASRMPQLVVPNLQIPQGERIAILGRNGSGKSTLLKLLAAVATPSGGQVCIAGLDYEECRPSWLREVIGYLPQDVRLFSGTLLDNLTLGMSMPSETAIYAAMEKTGLLAVVQNHPEGLHLPISEGGAGLSGGQRQLVGVTRMVLQNPRIWLLDEPTASLDSDAEGLLRKLIQELPEDRTVIYTTHRVQWLDLSHRVFIMEGGKIKVDEPREKVKAIASQQSAKSGSAQPETSQQPGPPVNGQSGGVRA
ncbi:ATP-binding cassette domain-containing protein [Algiphilus sp. NNCM1]|uniref:ATP-binding cassette domain-containing protein n=1 Tax=Algiphilus sp. TaxID=1872431 RepID=UPI001CA72CDC|nr:ATP-binding cassette domain-containing protein [Algiphilus sp.]MBY8967133.1 ATP-binding cassette domain-containing protein [Algiphilus acroporae]MCI5062050.1 ATP-binding cassette domain-containing protein [Algiphilus sp.]MCI5102593.1 ATP-binding cassette domain-containing protein [Algiphilus sp.]